MNTDRKPWLALDDFMSKYTQDELDKVVQAIADWTDYAGSQAHINARAKELIKHRHMLQDVMDLTAPDRPMFRGLNVEPSNDMVAFTIGDTFRVKASHVVQSWTCNEDVARSFAQEFHPEVSDRIVGLVLKLKTVSDDNVLLAPPARTARWFEQLIRKEMTRRAKTSRREEHEYLLVSKSYLVELVDKFFNDTTNQKRSFQMPKVTDVEHFPLPKGLLDAAGVESDEEYEEIPSKEPEKKEAALRIASKFMSRQGVDLSIAKTISETIESYLRRGAGRRLVALDAHRIEWLFDTNLRLDYADDEASKDDISDQITAKAKITQKEITELLAPWAKDIKGVHVQYVQDGTFAIDVSLN